MSNLVTPLSAEEKLALRNKAKAELDRLEATFADEEIKQKIDIFKDRFSICEIVYKVILEDHQYNKYGIHKERLQVSMKEAPHALTYAGYNFEYSLLTNLFGAEERVGKRSVKKLRDALTHNINKGAVDELINRDVELHSYMDEFLKIIHEFDSSEAA